MTRPMRIHSGKFRRRGRICARCFPDGTILQTNAAGNGRRTENTSFSNLRGRYGTLPEEGAFLHQSTGKPIQLTSSPLGLFTPLPSKDGKKLFVVGRTYRGELERGESKSGKIHALSLGHLCRRRCVFQRRPVGGLRLLPRRHPLAKQAGWQREGTAQLPSSVGSVCRAGRPTANRLHSLTDSAGKPEKIYLVSADGGSPQQLLPEDPEPQQDPRLVAGRRQDSPGWRAG